MTTLYLVRCNYADDATLEEWGRWYSGPKQNWLLSRPGFIAGQRFSAVCSTDGVRYAALYAIDSPEALKTPEYQSSWGWAQYRPHIIEWTRNFFGDADPAAFLTPDDGFLQVVFVDWGADAGAARDAYPRAVWLSAKAGLDETLGAIGFFQKPEDGPVAASAEGVAVAVLRPESPARYSDGAAGSPAR